MPLDPHVIRRARQIAEEQGRGDLVRKLDIIEASNRLERGENPEPGSTGEAILRRRVTGRPETGAVPSEEDMFLGDTRRALGSALAGAGGMVDRTLGNLYELGETTMGMLRGNDPLDHLGVNLHSSGQKPMSQVYHESADAYAEAIETFAEDSPIAAPVAGMAGSIVGALPAILSPYKGMQSFGALSRTLGSLSNVGLNAFKGALAFGVGDALITEPGKRLEQGLRSGAAGGLGLGVATRYTSTLAKASAGAFGYSFPETMEFINEPSLKQATEVGKKAGLGAFITVFEPRLPGSRMRTPYREHTPVERLALPSGPQSEVVRWKQSRRVFEVDPAGEATLYPPGTRLQDRAPEAMERLNALRETPLGQELTLLQGQGRRVEVALTSNEAATFKAEGLVQHPLLEKIFVSANHTQVSPAQPAHMIAERITRNLEAMPTGTDDAYFLSTLSSRVNLQPRSRAKLDMLPGLRNELQRLDAFVTDALLRQKHPEMQRKMLRLADEQAEAAVARYEGGYKEILSRTPKAPTEGERLAAQFAEEDAGRLANRGLHTLRRADWDNLDKDGVIYEALGQAQRGAPEEQMVRTKKKLGGGVMNPLIEHVGDLTERMTKPGSLKGYDVMNKIQRSLRLLKDKYGTEREFLENLTNNLEVRVRTGKVSLADYSPEQFRAEAFAELQAYADAHRQLPVFNVYQKHARDAAVALGERRFQDATKELETLQRLLGTKTSDENRLAKLASVNHELFLRDALARGEDVPSYVLSDYVHKRWAYRELKKRGALPETPRLPQVKRGEVYMTQDHGAVLIERMGKDSVDILSEKLGRETVSKVDLAKRLKSELPIRKQGLTLHANPIGEIWSQFGRALDAMDSAVSKWESKYIDDLGKWFRNNPTMTRLGMVPEFSSIPGFRAELTAMHLKNRDVEHLINKISRSYLGHNPTPEQEAIFWQLMDGSPLDMKQLEQIKDIDPKIIDQWRGFAQEMTALRKNLGLTVNDEWLDGDKFWWPRVFKSHMSLGGRLYRVQGEAKVVSTSASRRLTEQQTTGKWIVKDARGNLVKFRKINRDTGKRITMDAAFGSEQEAQDLAMQLGWTSTFSTKDKQQVRRIFKNTQEAQGFIQRVLFEVPEVREVGSLKQKETVDKIKAILDRDYPNIKPGRYAEVVSLIGKSRSTGERYTVLPPMTFEQLVAHNLITNPVQIMQTQGNREAINLHRLKLVEQLAEMKDEMGREMFAPDGTEGYRKLRGKFIPDDIASRNATLARFNNEAVLESVATSIENLWGPLLTKDADHTVMWRRMLTVAGRMFGLAENSLRWGMTVGNPFRYLKQPMENEVSLFFLSSQASGDIQARTRFTKEFIDHLSGRVHSPIVDDAIKIGIHADSIRSEQSLRQVLKGIDTGEGWDLTSAVTLDSKLFDTLVKGKHLAETLYAGEDFFYKTYAWAYLQGRLGNKVRNPLSAEEAYSSIIQGFFQYDQAPPIIKSLARIIPFKPSVLYQFSRIIGNHMKDRPVTTATKLLMLAGSGSFVKHALMEEAGLTSEELEGMLPKHNWTEFVTPIQAENGKYWSFDIGFLVPFWSDVNYLQDADYKDRLSPILGMSPLLASLLYKGASGRDFTGRSMIDPRMTLAQDLKERTKLIFRNVHPLTSAMNQMLKEADKLRIAQNPWYEPLLQGATGVKLIDPLGSRLTRSYIDRQRDTYQRGVENQESYGEAEKFIKGFER